MYQDIESIIVKNQIQNAMYSIQSFKIQIKNVYYR